MRLVVQPGCIGASRRALYRVFISPAVAAAAAPTRHHQLSTPCVPGASWPATFFTCRARLVSSRSRPQPNSRGPRPASLRDSAASEGRGFDIRFTTQLDIERSGRDRPPRDHEIKDPQIVVVGGGGQGVSGPIAPSLVLSRLGPDESLRMLQPYVPADPEAGLPQPRLAVCKVVNKRDEYARQRQLRAQDREARAAAGSGGGGNSSNSPKTKELELTWAIGAHDLATKMRQMGGFLAKGSKVELMLARKRGGKPVSADEAAEVVRRVRAEMEAHGGREVKPASGQVGGTLRLFVEALAKK